MLHCGAVKESKQKCGRFFLPLEIRQQYGWPPLAAEPIRYELSNEQYLRSLRGDPALQRTAESLAAAFRRPVVFVHHDRLVNWADPPANDAAEGATEQSRHPNPTPESSPQEVRSTSKSGVHSIHVEPPEMPTVELPDELDTKTREWSSDRSWALRARAARARG